MSFSFILLVTAYPPSPYAVLTPCPYFGQVCFRFGTMRVVRDVNAVAVSMCATKCVLADNTCIAFEYIVGTLFTSLLSIYLLLVLLN